MTMSTNSEGAFGSTMGRYFLLDDAPYHVSKLAHSTIAVTQLRCDKPRIGVTDLIPAEDSYIIGVQMRKPSMHSLWLNDKFVPSQQFQRDSLCFVHLDGDARVDLHTAFHIVQFHVPRAGLTDIASDFGVRRVEHLRCPPLGAIDPILSQLVECLLPSFESEEDVCAPFVDHVLLAMQAHVARKYGEMRIPVRTGKERLAPWQIRRAKELISARISTSLSLSELAAECGISVSHFARAFKATVGVAPHQWLVQRRMEIAKLLLSSTQMATADIALECGFSHRVAFSNAFRRIVGTSPGEWRRMCGGRHMTVDEATSQISDLMK